MLMLIFMLSFDAQIFGVLLLIHLLFDELDLDWTENRRRSIGRHRRRYQIDAGIGDRHGRRPSTDDQIAVERRRRRRCRRRFGLDQTCGRIFKVDAVMFDQMLANGDDVGCDVRTKSTNFFVGVVRRLADVLVLKVGVHRDVTLKPIKWKLFL